MRLPELDQLIVDTLVQDDHPEIVRVELIATNDRPTNPTRLVVTFTDGSTAVLMVDHVEGPGVPRHAPYELPAALVSA